MEAPIPPAYAAMCATPKATPGLGARMAGAIVLMAEQTIMAVFAQEAQHPVRGRATVEAGKTHIASTSIGCATAATIGMRCRTHASSPDTDSATASKHLKSLKFTDSFRVGRAVQQKRRVLITNLVSFECVAASSSACGQCPLCLVNAAKCSYFYLQ